MRNEQILAQAAMELFADGKIFGSGEGMNYRNRDGTETRIMFPERICSLLWWERFGYRLKTGQKPVATVPLWRSEPGDQDGKYRMIPTDIYAEHQVFVPKFHTFR